MKFPESPQPAAPNTPTRAEIEFRAYKLWEQDGRPEGADLEFWLEAEHQLRIEYAKRPKIPDSGKMADARELVTKVQSQLSSLAPAPKRPSITSTDLTH